MYMHYYYYQKNHKKKLLMQIYYVNHFNSYYTPLGVLGVIQNLNKKLNNK